MNRCDNPLYSTSYDIGYYIKTFGEKFVAFNLYGLPRIQCMAEIFQIRIATRGVCDLDKMQIIFSVILVKLQRCIQAKGTPLVTN